MFEFLKKSAKNELCFDNFTAEEIIRMGSMYSPNDKLLRKLQNIVFTEFVMKEAKDKQEIDVARKIFTKIIDAMEGFSLIDSSQYDPDGEGVVITGIRRE